ncbi:PRC-barrel domain-containing protein [Algicella marina]|uniref:PRC-barrel domain-containing protein n=1 Tax=Algicella marina TaxID=2683284 RepID=A0A6P1SVA7_9RHOB|nr:PRC-barrel domain-containing protein [Algicella marina]QHQ33707.1 hypothetical protein GO499_00200 [Algicella marina]
MKHLFVTLALGFSSVGVVAQEAAQVPDTPAARADVTAEILAGADVFDADGQNMGQITDVVFTDSGKVDAAVIAAGGFLGFGRHEAAVPVEELTVMDKADAEGEIIVQVPMTEEQFKALPRFAAMPMPASN